MRRAVAKPSENRQGGNRGELATVCMVSVAQRGEGCAWSEIRWTGGGSGCEDRGNGVQVALEGRGLAWLETSGEGGAAAGPALNQPRVLERGQLWASFN